MTAVLTHGAHVVPSPSATAPVGPDDVHDVLARSILADGLDLVLDIERSHGSHLVDARTGETYLDMFTFFASSALGMNHPALADDEGFRDELAQAAVNKPSNSDVYSVPMARFVDTFARVLGDPALLNPEQLLLAAASSCQFLSFLAVAARSRWCGSWASSQASNGPAPPGKG